VNFIGFLIFSFKTSYEYFKMHKQSTILKYS